MKKINLMIATCLLVSLVGCQTAYQRSPGPSVTSKDWEELKDLKQRKVELAALSFHFHKKKNEVQFTKIQNEQKEIDKKIRKLNRALLLSKNAQKKIL